MSPSWAEPVRQLWTRIVTDAPPLDLREVAGPRRFAVWTDDCDATAGRIGELGLPTRDVISGPTGLRQVFVKDPDGNMVEFIGPSKNAAARRMEENA